MNYSVVLVQQGISAQSHPVTGKSGKLYGTAVASPEHGGVVLQMSMEDYLSNAHDVVGNLAAHQQWVPEFVPASPKAGQQKCDRCQKPAVARWDKYFYCLDHAPDNAIMTDGSGKTAGEVKGKAPIGAVASSKPDVQPRVEERLSKPIEEEKELPAEHLPAPIIGTAQEDGSPAAQPDPAATVAAQPKNPTAPPKEEPKNAVEAIAHVVVETLLPQLDAMIATKIAAAAKAIDHKKPAKKVKTARPETEFSKLQKRAKELGINSFGKNAEKLRAEIAAFSQES